MDLKLAGKTVVVTGGSGNIGRGLVLEFAREGANVISADRDPGDELAVEAEKQGSSRGRMAGPLRQETEYSTMIS